MKRTIILALCVLLLTACSAFRVHDNNKKNMKGIPFYIKKGVVKQVTIYNRSWIEATVNYYKMKDDKEISGTERSATIYISETSYNQLELLKIFAKADESAANGFGAAIETFQILLIQSCDDKKTNCEISPQTLANEANPEHIFSTSLLQSLESNSSSYEAIVDYQNPYYFNATVPTFGTTTASTKLASDGTLTEVSSTLDSSKLAELIPLKELLIDKWGLEEIAGVAMAVPAPRDFSFTISININGYKYNISKFHPYEAGLNLSPLKFDTDGISVSRAKFKDTQKKDDENEKKAISIEGSIVLPEDK